MNKRIILLFTLVIFLFSSTALAAEFIAPTKDDDPNITLSASQTFRNLYVAGANVTINSAVKGDLSVAGGMVSVIGDIEGDLNLAGGSVSLSGKVGGDSRIAGGNLTISSSIGGDLLLAGGNVSISEKSSIGGDLVIGGGNIVLDAPVKGNVRAGAGNLTINSKIEGNVLVYSTGRRKSEGNLIFGPKAEIAGKIIHKGPKPATVKEGAVISEIEYTKRVGQRSDGKFFAGIVNLALLIKILAWLFVAIILIKYRRNDLQKVALSIKEKPWENLGLGFVGLVAVPVIILLLLATLVGYYAAGFLVIWFVLMLMFAFLTGAIFFGAWLMKLITKAQEFIFSWKTALLGIVSLAVFKFVPVFGWLVYAVIFLMALGALLRLAKEKWLEESRVS